MAEETKKQSGRPPEKSETISEQGQAKESGSIERSFEFNSLCGTQLVDAFFNCGIYDYFTEEEISGILLDPIRNFERTIELSNFVYNKSGIIGNSIDYMVSLPCLDRVITYAASKPTVQARKNKGIMQSVLKVIDDKHFIRDALHTMMNNGIYFYYFETKVNTEDRQKYLSNWDIDSIFEINSAGINATIITLPWRYTRIIGKKNGRFQLAFNLEYFNNFTSENERNRKLRSFPKEIRDGWSKYHNGGTEGKNWLRLDQNKTMCRKIKCADSEPWGRPLAIGALQDILYQDKFIGTKRNVLDNINHQVWVHEFPAGEKKGTCALTKTGQENQHATVRDAILNKNTISGQSVVSVASGTNIKSLEVSTDIFNDENEGNLNNTISLDMGICASLLGSMASGGNYSSQVNNLQMITSQVYTFVYEIQEDLNYVIDRNIIKSKANNAVAVYYFPTSFINKKEFFEEMKTLYSEAGGSYRFLVAATGVDPDIYLSVLRDEYDEGLFDMITPHPTSYTMSTESVDESPDPSNENTIKSQSNGANQLPDPSS